MNPRHDHHLTGRPGLPGDSAPGCEASTLDKPPGMAWRDFLIMLLQMGAEVEHGLMVQYLFAAYTINTQNVPEHHRRRVREWQDQILTVAREEMGHLLTVQNVLCLLGGPASFGRRDFPWDTPFYPFPFQLERLSRDVLALFVFAEMPDSVLALVSQEVITEADIACMAHLLMGEEDQAIAESDHHRHRSAERLLRHDLPYIRKVVGSLLNRDGKRPVGEIYQRILEIISDPTKIRDTDFRPETYDFQSSWDDWGRGYKPAPAAPGGEGPPPGSRKTNVLILQVGTRTEAVDALRQVMGQGEAPDLRKPGVGDSEQSHFARFARIYQQFQTHVIDAKEEWQPVRDVASNPTTLSETATLPEGAHCITEPGSLVWANLFNLRYRILLTYLTHTYRLSRTTNPDFPNARGAIMHKVFAEMYNLKAIAGILVQLPLTAFGDPHRAGPPFEMPYSLVLPEDEVDCWRLYRDLMDTSIGLANSLLSEYEQATHMPPEGREYLLALRHLDTNHRDWLDQMPGGLKYNAGGARPNSATPRTAS